MRRIVVNPMTTKEFEQLNSDFIAYFDALLENTRSGVPVREREDLAERYSGG